MSMTVNVPEELYQKAVEIAESQHLSVDEVFASAFADQISAWERLQQRAARGSREKFLAVLDKVPDVEPEDFDRP
jgi:predicted transcriptional regulator